MNQREKNHQLWTAIAWIAAYVVLFGTADNLSRGLGTEKLLTAPLCVLFVAALLVWLRRSGLTAYYGLRRFQGKPSRYLYFLPLVLLGSVNLWNGVTMNFTPLESALYVLCMLCVGFIEEVLFRGILFQTLRQDGLKSAVLISSLTFGIGHIVNLMNGAELLPTLLQICYACAIGFLFTVLFLRSGSLLPCILTHSAVNALSAFAVEPSRPKALVMAAVMTVVPLGYAVWILRMEKTAISE